MYHAFPWYECIGILGVWKCITKNTAWCFCAYQRVSLWWSDYEFITHFIIWIWTFEARSCTANPMQTEEKKKQKAVCFFRFRILYWYRMLFAVCQHVYGSHFILIRRFVSFDAAIIECSSASLWTSALHSDTDRRCGNIRGSKGNYESFLILFINAWDFYTTYMTYMITLRRKLNC